MKSKQLIPKKYVGNLAVDDRGSVKFVNDFDFAKVKRFYQVENHNTRIIRAFHGHLKEAKYVYVSKGSIILCAVPLTDPLHSSKISKVERFILSADQPCVLYVPAGFANGFKVLEKGSIVLFFSTASLKETQGDDYRYPFDYWGTEIWQTENR